MKKKRIIIFTIMLFFILISACILIVIFKEDKPTISVDYGKKIDELTKPQNYDPNQNAASLIEQAIVICDHCEEFEMLRMYPETHQDWNLMRFEVVCENRVNEIQKQIDSTMFKIAMDFIEQAAAKKFFWRQFRIIRHQNYWGDDFYDVEGLNYNIIVRSLVWRGRLLEHNGEIEKAISDHVNAYKISNFLPDKIQNSYSFYADEKKIVFRNLVDIIHRNPIKAKILLKTQQEIENLPHDDMDLCIEASRLMCLDTIQRSFTDDGNGNGKVIITSFINYRKSQSSWKRDCENDLKLLYDDIRYYEQRVKSIKNSIDDRKITIKKINKAYDMTKKLYKQTPCQVQKTTGIIQERPISKIAGNNYYVFSQHVEYYDIYQHYHESICHDQALVTILAIKRYKAENDSYPASLKELLEEGYIKKIPMDPYSDKPLVYKITDKVFILYSVGRDFTDDGGKYNESEKWEETKKGSDYIFYPVGPKEKETKENTWITPYFTDPNYDPNDESSRH